MGIKASNTDRLPLDLRCGSCFYLKVKHPKIEASCSKLGCVKGTVACKLYDPDYAGMQEPGTFRENSSNDNRVAPSVFIDIGKQLRGLNRVQRQHIAFAIVNIDLTEKRTEEMLDTRLTMGQPVWVNLSTPYTDYLNCWFRGSVMGVNRTKDGLIVTAESPAENGRHVFLIKSLKTMTGILTRKQFKEHAVKLIESKRINAPKDKINAYLPTVPLKGLTAADYMSPGFEVVHEQIISAPEHNITLRTKVKSSKAAVKSSKIGGDLIIEIS